MAISLSVRYVKRLKCRLKFYSQCLHAVKALSSNAALIMCKLYAFCLLALPNLMQMKLNENNECILQFLFPGQA